MHSTIQENEKPQPKPKPYPKLVEHVSKFYIVFKTSEKVGIVVYSKNSTSSENYPVGYHSSNWSTCENDFIDCPECVSVKLQNS